MNKIEFIAHFRHQCWCSYQLGARQPFNPVINADQLESLMDGVEYQLAHPDTTPEENHGNWMKMKIKQGWVYGPVKDFDKKTHPDLLPYKDLPEIERLKDQMDILAHRKALELFEQINNSDKIREVLNLLGGPVMSYAPSMVIKEYGDRIREATKMLMEIK